MTGERFHRRGLLLATGAAAAGCLGDGSVGDGDDLTGNQTDGDGPPGNGSKTTTATGCGRLTERYVRHDPGASAFFFTVEVPATNEEISTIQKTFWEMRVEKDIGAYEAELRLRQVGPMDELPAGALGEGDDPVVAETTFDGVEVPIVRHTAGDRPEFYTGVPVPGKEDVFATVVASFSMRGPTDDSSGACLDAGKAVQMHAIDTLEPNPDHEFGVADGGASPDDDGETDRSG